MSKSSKNKNRYTVITTVGTSLFTNFMGSYLADSYDIRSKVEALEELPASAYDPADRRVQYLVGRGPEDPGVLQLQWFKGIERQGKIFEEADDEEALNLDACAEISSLIALHQALRARQPKASLEVQLVATDTVLSILAAQLIAQFLAQPEIEDDFDGIGGVIFDPKQDYVPDLRVSPPPGWKGERPYQELGLHHLIRQLVGQKGYLPLTRAEDRNRPFIINFSGGYKAIIPPLTLIAQAEELEMCYLYDESNFLIEFGSLPFQFDWTVIERFYPYYFRDRFFAQDQLSAWEKEDLAELTEYYKLFHETTKGYKRTFLGDFFADYIQRRSPESVNVMGFFMEYKFLEYRINYPYQDYHQVRRSMVVYTGQSDLLAEKPEGKGIQKLAEADLLLQNPAGKRVVAEIKTAAQVQYAFEAKPGGNKNLAQQMTNLLERLKAIGKLPEEFHLYFYRLYVYRGGPRTARDGQQLQGTLLQLADLVTKVSEGQTVMRAFWAEQEANLKQVPHQGGKNPFSNIGQGFRADDVKSIPLNA